MTRQPQLTRARLDRISPPVPEARGAMRNELLRERDEICARIKADGRRANEAECNRLAEILEGLGRTW